jgi:predicted ArsR family transcriptional regulator
MDFTRFPGGNDSEVMKSDSGENGWTFLTNHALVLLQVWRTPDMTVRDIATRVGVTERAALRIMADLVAEGYVSRRRMGRNNHYFVDRERKMRHPEVAHCRIERLLQMIESDRT